MSDPITTVTTEYAMLHPLFPAQSCAQRYGTIEQAMEDAETWTAVHGGPAVIGKRVRTTVTEYSKHLFVSPSGHTLPADEPVGIPTRSVTPV